MNQTPQADPWCYREHSFRAADAAYKESLFAVGNGYLGIRGYFDEGYPDGTPNTSAACFLNGVYESLPIEYDESAYGFAKNCHRIVPVPRQYFEIELNGVRFSFVSEQVINYLRELNFQTGTYTRTVTWQCPTGEAMEISFERAASHQNESVARAQLTIRPLNFNGIVTVRSVLDPSNSSLNDVDDPRKGGTIPAENWLRQAEHHASDGSYYHYRTRNSGIDVVAFMTTQADEAEITSEHSEQRSVHQVSLNVSEGKLSRVVSTVSYTDSRKHAENELLNHAQRSAAQLAQLTHDEFSTAQTKALRDFWSTADIQIDSDDGAQYATRFSLFHLFQSTGRDGLSSIAAKGLTGAGYDGHYFWDSETYIFPFWLFSHPDMAKSLLQYRVSTLASAKQRAREMGHAKGALFAWRTIGGEECSSYFPAGSAQYHINADIAYASKSYFQATNDFTFLKEGLAELVLETARIWLDLGHSGDDGQFRIFAVTGPDEYTAVVNNNFYTNKMAQAHLHWACELAQMLLSEQPAFAQELMQRINLQETEIIHWQQAANSMYLPFDKDKQIYAQDDSFLQKPRWDFENTPAEKYPLLLHFHPLVIYRHQVLKQADTLLALLLAGDDIDPDTKKRCFDYYEPINTHDSTLSTCVHGVIANEIGYAEKAYDYYRTTMHLDLDDAHHNTYYGVHTAAMGGIWMGAVQGFAGLRYASGQLSFRPSLPAAWRSLSFKVSYQGRVIAITLNHQEASFELCSGEALTVLLNGKPLHVEQSLKTASL